MNDLIIIGAGPAGLTAALYASRAGATVLILDGGAPGGKLNLTATIENYPGAKEMKGPELAYQMYEQALMFGAKQEYGLVTSIIDKEDHKEVFCGEKMYEAKYVIIASGTKERTMGLANEDELTGHGISYCAVCDGPFFKNEEVAVIGGGNSALEEALYLSTIASKVHVIVRRDVFRADKILQDRILSNDKVQVHFKKKPHKILSKDNKVSGLEVIDSDSDEVSSIALNGIFPFIGLDPISDFAKDLNIIDDKGYIVVDDNMETKVPGIFAVGDVRQKTLRQVVTATNDGAIAGQYIANKIV